MYVEPQIRDRDHEDNEYSKKIRINHNSTYNEAPTKGIINNYVIPRAVSI